MKRLALLLLTLSAAPAAAQEGGAAAGSSAVASVVPSYRQVYAYILSAAEAVPAQEYGFRPTPEVRSFGQLVGHIANAQYAICSSALGEESPARQNYEETAGKAELIEALRGSGAVCDRAYAQTDAQAMQTTQLFGQERTRLAALVLNATHDWEHYGNLVTYMRIQGLVPPSSQGG